jgi:hypothetical protein
MNQHQPTVGSRPPDVDTARDSSSRWLHNFGMAPQTELIVSASSSKRTCGYGIRFQIPRWNGSAGSLINRLRHKKLTSADNLDELQSELDALSHQLELPPAVVVSSRKSKTDFICECPLVCAAVLSKTGHNVYLRNKHPRIEGICKSVVLVLPEKSDLDRFRNYMAEASHSSSPARKGPS